MASKIIILTQYFPPEVGAPQNRLFELAIRLKKFGSDVTILTAMPNYPDMKIHRGYRNSFYKYEEIEGLKIHRTFIFVSGNRNFLFRIINYFSFVISSVLVGVYKLRRSDYLFCESPPLFLGISAHMLAKAKKSKLIFNVSDLWPESAVKLNLVKNRFLISWSKHLEQFLYRKADFISGQTQNIVSTIARDHPKKKIFWLKNGVDIETFNQIPYDKEWRIKNGFKKDDYLLLYAGILGYAQGLEVIMHTAELLKDRERIHFVFVGNGPEKLKLLRLKEKMDLKNVHFKATVTKDQMPSIIRNIDAAIIPLKKIELFKGAIPSKIFENLALHKPILLGVDGEAKELFIHKGKCGLFFEPENFNDLSDKILKLSKDEDLSKILGENGFDYIKKYFNRDKIAADFWNFIHDNSEK